MTKSSNVLNLVCCAKELHSIGMRFLLYAKGPAPGSIMQQYCINQAQEHFSRAHGLMACAKEIHKANA